MAAFARTELDLLGLARQDNQAAVQLFVIRDGKMRRSRRVPARTRSGRTRRRGPRPPSWSSTTPARELVPREVIVPALPSRPTPTRDRVPAPRRGGPVHLHAPARRERQLVDATRNAAETLAREQARWLADQGGRWPRSRSWPTRWGWPARRCASSATTSPTSRAANRSAAWSCSRTASRAAASTAGSGSRRSAGPNDFASHQEVLRRRFPGPRAARRGAPRRRAGRCPTWSSSTAARARSARPRRSSTSWPARPAAGRAGQGARGAVPARPSRPDRAAARPRRRCTWSSGCATRRIGSPSPTTASCARSGRSALRRPARRGPGASALLQRVRIDQARARGAGRADRRGAGHQPLARRARSWRRRPRRRRLAPANAPARRPRRPARYSPARCEASVPILIPCHRRARARSCLLRLRSYLPALSAMAAAPIDQARPRPPGGPAGEYQRSPTERRRHARDLADIQDIIENARQQDRRRRARRRNAGLDRIVVEIPASRTPIRRPGRLDRAARLRAAVARQHRRARDRGPAEIPPLFSGDQIASGGRRAGPERPASPVDFAFKTKARGLFGDYTANHTGEQLRDRPRRHRHQRPVINAPILGGKAQITGGGMGQPNEATSWSPSCSSAPCRSPSRGLQQISPTLGEQFLQQSLLAGPSGSRLVFIFMLMHYRLPGVVACVRADLLRAGRVRDLPAHPGDADPGRGRGFVLSVGMAVDANILIFERTKEELRSARRSPAAIEAGFNRAGTRSSTRTCRA